MPLRIKDAFYKRKFETERLPFITYSCELYGIRICDCREKSDSMVRAKTITIIESKSWKDAYNWLKMHNLLN